jgi:hypothetical protein
MAGQRQHIVVGHRKFALNTLQGEATTLHASPAAFYVVR